MRLASRAIPKFGLLLPVKTNREQAHSLYLTESVGVSLLTMASFSAAETLGHEIHHDVLPFVQCEAGLTSPGQARSCH